MTFDLLAFILSSPYRWSLQLTDDEHPYPNMLRIECSMMVGDKLYAHVQWLTAFETSYPHLVEHVLLGMASSLRKRIEGGE